MSVSELRAAMEVELFGNAWRDGGTRWGHEVNATGVCSGRCVLYVCRAGGMSLAAAGGDGAALAGGSACIVPAGTAHSVTTCEGSAFARIELDLDLLGDLMPELGLPGLALAQFGVGRRDGGGDACGGGRAVRTARMTVLEGFYNDDLRVLIKRISYELGAANDRRLFTLRGMVGDLVLGIEHALAGKRRGTLRIDDVLAYLNETYATASLRDTAEHFYCHPNSIANLIKRELGMTFLELVTSIRIDRARLLFEVDNLSVQEVALACGYRNMTHFYEVFRARCGMSPGEYRRAVAKRAS